MENINLTFIANYGAYHKGDVANFPPAAAGIILATGAAMVMPNSAKQPDSDSASAFVARRSSPKSSKIIKK